MDYFEQQRFASLECAYLEPPESDDSDYGDRFEGISDLEYESMKEDSLHV